MTEMHLSILPCMQTCTEGAPTSLGAKWLLLHQTTQIQKCECWLRCTDRANGYEDVTSRCTTAGEVTSIDLDRSTLSPVGPAAVTPSLRHSSTPSLRRSVAPPLGLG
mmetsp:Transcript_22672/g.41731  ORF Transcript_22672/g.41731 Transcript_22672/m.41731 type:complete len:107 (-) Transcript_22672:64-384(-)